MRWEEKEVARRPARVVVHPQGKQVVQMLANSVVLPQVMRLPLRLQFRRRCRRHQYRFVHTPHWLTEDSIRSRVTACGGG